MKTYLVTGVAGFIASRTAALLLEKGEQVVGLDNMNHYYDIQLKNYRLKNLEKHSNFIFKNIDIEDLNALKAVFEEYQFEGIINLAARAGVRYSMENPHVYLTTNTHGTLNLLEMMRQYKIKKKVLASTSSLYAGLPMPFLESLPVNTPISPYAASKKGAEMMCYSYHKLYELDISVVRYFTVYGPAGRPDMSIFRFIKWIAEEKPLILYGDGSQARDFTFVDDIARGTIRAIEEKVGFEIINLGGGENPISLNYMIEFIEKTLNKKAIINRKPFHIADMTETWANIEKAKKLLNWAPEVDFDTGLKKSIDWYLENQNWLKNVSTEEGGG